MVVVPSLLIDTNPCGTRFKSLEELESLINKLLNEGGLTIRWGRKIKNKGSSTIAS
jgi:hypothetical protein